MDAWMDALPEKERKKKEKIKWLDAWMLGICLYSGDRRQFKLRGK